MDRDIRALFLNCTLKPGPETSNTRALIDKAVDLFEEQGVESEVIRVVDFNIRFGISSDEGKGDEWPKILSKILKCNILIIGTPIWFGVRGSIAQMVMERLDGTYAQADEETGQFPLYNKVAGCIVTGNEDGAHEAAGTTLFNLSHLGCVVPPNCDSYWVGEAGPGPSYIKAGGEKHMYTNKTVRYLVHNCTYFARLLQANPIPTNLKALTEDAKKVSGK